VDILSDIIIEVVFWAILAHVTWPRAQPLGQAFCWSFHWKLGSSPSLWSLWSTF